MKGTYYKLSDQDRENLESHKLTFDEIDSIGFDILDGALSGEVIDDHLIPIRSLLYRLLEFNDTLSVMVENSLINTAFSIVRSSFEILVQLRFILSSADEMPLKAMTYHYCDYRQRYNDNEVDDFNSRMEESVHFSKIHEDSNTFPNSKKNSWYSVYLKKRTTFRDLCENVGFLDRYLKLYPHLSSDIHGNSCLELNTVCLEDGGKYYLKNFRHFERNYSLTVLQIDFMRHVYADLNNRFDLGSELSERIEQYYDRAEAHLNTYWKIKESDFDPLPEYSI